MTPVIIEISEGRVQEVYSGQPAEVIIIDWDRDPGTQPLAYRLEPLALHCLALFSRLALASLAPASPAPRDEPLSERRAIGC